MMKTQVIVLAVMILVVVLLLGIAMATKKWTNLEYKSGPLDAKTNYGLWRAASSGLDPKTPSPATKTADLITGSKGKLKTCQALSIIGLILILVGGILVLVYDKIKIPFIVHMVAIGLGVLFTLITVVLWASNSDLNGKNEIVAAAITQGTATSTRGSSYFIYLLGSIVAIILFIYVVLNRKKFTA